ncbi:hypothetical protein ZYGR_0AD04830 [Zygosaccharomyces rouxii]|uniref:PCI domain-containing protein n=1 Tax=Zygosaccharomyces rouxii TaxID=4956 RepID=A0A1Q3A6U4_ZYGRO|nr:hypothetical protein ZYGR_0AD04830 [Zygosaccharomyces rouxii]
MFLFFDANAYSSCSCSRSLSLPALSVLDCCKSNDRLIPPFFLGESVSCESRGFSAMDNLCSSILRFLIGDELEDDVDADEVASILNNNNAGKWRELYQATYQMRMAPDFNSIELQLRLLNRIAESETRWITNLLYGVARNLVDKCFKETETCDDADTNNSKLSQCARTIHRSFNLCLNDRNPNDIENRRVGCYSLAPLECKIYHRLQNRDMTKNLIKVLESRSNELNKDVPSHIVAYHYYIGEHYAYEGKHEVSCKHLQLALANCSYHSDQLWYILLLLVPQTMLCERRYCNVKTLQKICDAKTFSKLMKYYDVPLRCFIDGNVEAYDEHLERYERFFLSHNLYVCMLQLREMVVLKYCKLCWLHGSQKSITRLDVFTRNKRNDESLDQLECVLANLIAKGHVKGYLSHSNRCIVLSKRDPFPRRVTHCT